MKMAERTLKFDECAANRDRLSMNRSAQIYVDYDTKTARAICPESIERHWRTMKAAF